MSDYTEKNSNLIPQIDIPCFAWNSQAEQGFLFFKAKSLTGIKLVFSKDFYKAMLIYSAILPEAISLHISILILTNKKRYNRFNEKIL